MTSAASGLGRTSDGSASPPSVRESAALSMPLLRAGVGASTPTRLSFDEATPTDELSGEVRDEPVVAASEAQLAGSGSSDVTLSTESLAEVSDEPFVATGELLAVGLAASSDINAPPWTAAAIS